MHRQFGFADFFKACFFIELMGSDSIIRRIEHNGFYIIFLRKLQKTRIELPAEMMRFALILFIDEEFFEHCNTVAAGHYPYRSREFSVVRRYPEIAACVYIRLCNIQKIWLIVDRNRRACAVILKMENEVYYIVRIFFFKSAYRYHFIHSEKAPGITPGRRCLFYDFQLAHLLRC